MELYPEQKQLLEEVRTTSPQAKGFKSLCEDFLRALIPTYGFGGEGPFRRDGYCPKTKTTDNVEVIFLWYDSSILYHCKNSEKVCSAKDLDSTTLKELVEDLATYAENRLY